MMKIPFSPPDITEEEIAEVAEAMRSGWITTGPRVKLLESRLKDFCHSAGAVCLNSATAALELNLRVLGIGPGDEVITSAYTYTASASPILHVGARPVLVDTKPDSYEMDYDAVADAINERTKAVIPVDIGGVMCDYDRIFDIVEAKKGLFQPKGRLQSALGRIAVVADCAHALGAEWHGRRAGEVADFSSFSFHAVKNFTTAEGGCATWRHINGIDNDELYAQYQLLSLHGQNKDALAKTKLGAWEYDIKGCYYKCNMTDIMAAMGLVQLNRYPDLLHRRQEIIGLYDDGLQGLPIDVMAHRGEGYTGSGHLYMMRLCGKGSDDRSEFIEAMAEMGVATNVHYKPLPMMTAYRNLGFDIRDYPNAYMQFANEVTLPLHTKLSDEEVGYVIQAVKQCLI